MEEKIPRIIRDLRWISEDEDEVFLYEIAKLKPFTKLKKLIPRDDLHFKSLYERYIKPIN